MQEIYSDVLQFRGSHFDYGYKQGTLLKGSHTIENRKRQWKIRRPRFSIDTEETKSMFQQFAPAIWEELLGIQEALQWPLKDVLQDFSGYRLDYTKSGCSIFTGDDYMIRNYDYHPKTYEGRFTIYRPTDQGYAIIGPSQRITGRMDGMNEKGLVMGYNFMHRKKPGDGFICNMIGRIVLETCANVTEAIALLQEIPHRHSFSYTVLDKNNETFIVEATPRGTRVRSSHFCTNHFEIMTDENRNRISESEERLDTIKTQAPQISSAHDAFRMLNDTDRGIFSNEYKNWSGTIHTSAYFPQNQKVWFALGGNREPVVFDFGKWLQGENSRLIRVLGEVDTDLPFVHMQENVR